MDNSIQTSQQKEGAHHLTEGNKGGATSGPNAYGTDGAPTGVSTSKATSQENQLKTTQQIKGELSCPEGK